jgi:hypothetical protein
MTGKRSGTDVRVYAARRLNEIAYADETLDPFAIR